MMLSTINGIDFALALGFVLQLFGWLTLRDRWRQRLAYAEDRADRWALRAVEAQDALEALRGSIAAEVEARLDAAVEAALEAAERQQSAHDRVEALAEAVRRRLEAQGLVERAARTVSRVESHGPNPWPPDADTLPSVDAVESPLEAP